MKNKKKIQNLSYFVKRLKDNGFITWKIMDKYNLCDGRKWTLLINPWLESVYITCFVNDEYLDYEPSFGFDDGNILFKNNLRLKTLSMEIIINHLIERGVSPNQNLFKHKEKINSYDHGSK